ncbi:MAG TPA: PKD domain-containing protein [Bacteroidales bacterium]|nr:PKD domain-containing protein [Bacteroidales bacterium]HPO65834.1 PKD domain-containing protein [Bacteroidales bacterium]
MTNNLVYADSTDTSSFSWIGLDGNYATKRLNLKFLNNTWFRKGGNDSNARFYVNTSNTNDTLIIKNSIFYGFNNLVSGSGATVISHNAYSPEAGYNNNIDASGLKFKDTTSENSLDLALRYNSTGINGGDPAVNINLYPDTLDMAGNSRLYNDTIDMGAFEFIPLKITTQPLSVTVCEGDSASFVLNTNFAPETYQWQTSTDGLNWTSAGNNQNTYLIPSATITNGDTTITYIRCIVMTDGFENDTSNVAMLTVNPLPRKTLISNNDTQTVCIGTSIGSIIYSTVGVNGVSVTGLPSGVNNSFNNDTLTISSTPDTSGTFNYTVTFTGGCGNITDTGTIIVKPNMTISLTSTPGSNNQTVCVNSPISVITYSTTGATGATVSGLPSGVTGIWASNVVTISGTPDTSGTFNYTVTLTDGCGSASASGMLRVNDTISLLATVEPATTLTRGKITLTASGGDGNYSYSLDNSNFQTSNVFDNLLAGNYPAYVKDNSGCNASVANIRVDSIPSPCKASFSVSVDTTQRKVTFTNHSVAAMVYYWRFGDGITSNTFEPTHTYSSEGTYTACLSVYNNSQGCVSDTCMVINIYANLANRAVKSVFTYNHDSIDNRTLHFVNQSDNANGYYWIFGDGSYSTAESPSHTYLQPGTYRVCLASADTVNRKKDSYCMTVIAGNPTCTALADFQFVVDSTHQTRFFNTSTGTYHKVYWDFGDGEVSVNQNPTHQYEQPGSYNVVLTLFDTIGGCMNSSQKLVEVGYSPCRAAIEYFVDASNKTMWLSSNSIGNISEYLWQLDQGATLGGPSGSLTVPTAGVYNVTLSIYSDIDNCSDQVTEKIQVGSATCNATFSYLVDSLTQKTYFYGGQSAEGTRYYWLFGDGSYSTQTNPVHQYRQVGLYTASLTIFNPTTQCMDYFEQTIVIGGQGSDCEANFVYFPSNTNVQQIRFRDRSNAKGSIVNYIWDFGDGTWSTLKNPVHTFNKQGLYNICLSITNSNGISNMSCQTIRVGANANDLPKANFTYQVDPDSLTVYLQNTSSGQYSLLQWQLGDGYSTTDSNPIYTYSQAGLYLVSLRVSDNTYTSYRYRLLNVGLTDTFAVKFAYIVNQYSKKAGGYPVDFIGAGLGDEVRLKWNFGDGNTDTTSNSPTHVYADTGTYQVCLTMSDPITGQAATYCEPITAQSLCQSDTIKPTALCKSITVYLNSSGVVDITPLDIDNGSSDACGIASRILSKTHFTQSNLGNNTVTLTVADAMGNSASCNAIVNVQKGTNIDNYTPIELAVYPNPFAKLLYVHLFLEQTDQVEITLTDLAGKRVKTLEKANQQAGEKLYLFDMSDIRNGSYILQVKTLKGLLKQRVVIKN